MRCKRHYTDLSSTVGVCASCLRERLFHLVTAQVQPQAQTQTLEQINRNSAFPRSVSPYITPRKTDNSASSINNQHNGGNRYRRVPDRRFFSTPQVAPMTGSYNPGRKKQNRFIGFSILSNLFRSKKRSEDSNPRSCGGDDSAASVTSSPFSFSNIRSGGNNWKKQAAGVIRKQYCPDRSMSPVRYSDCDDAEDEFCDGSIGESRNQTPWRTPVVRRGGGGGGGGQGKSVSGLSFCLSPLVRVSPCRNWNQKGVAPVDCGEMTMRSPVKVHLSNTKPFCGNRSRKLADFGRFATNR